MASRDVELFETASRLLVERWVPERHEVAAALRGESGRVYPGLHLEASIGRVAICAEAVALGMAVTAGETAVEAVIAVHCRDRDADRPEKIEVLPPCGMCRELISDYSPAARILLADDGAIHAVAVGDLLPHKPAGDWSSRGR